MEALLEREGDVDSWNDERMDELSRRMDAGFEAMATKEEMNRRFDEMDCLFGQRLDGVNDRLGRFEGSVASQFSEINDRLDRLNHTLLIGTFGVIAALIANGFFS
jgi:hypothetical protein